MYSSVFCSFQMGQFQNMIYSICTVLLVFTYHSNAGSVKLREIRLTRGIFKTPFVLFSKRTQLQVKPQLAVLWTCLNISHKKIISTETFNIISEYKPTYELEMKAFNFDFWRAISPCLQNDPVLKSGLVLQFPLDAIVPLK